MRATLILAGVLAGCLASSAQADDPACLDVCHDTIATCRDAVGPPRTCRSAPKADRRACKAQLKHQHRLCKTEAVAACVSSSGATCSHPDTCLATSGTFCDLGDGTVFDSATGLQWEKKTVTVGLHDVTDLYSWAGCCNGDCSMHVFCQPDPAAAATCAANDHGNMEGCSTCAVGTCDVDPDDAGAITTVWDWINQLNAASFAGHDDWRVPSEHGNDPPFTGPKELQSILSSHADGACSTGPPCIDPIFGTTAAGTYWSADTYVPFPSSAWRVRFSSVSVSSFSKDQAFNVRAVR